MTKTLVVDTGGTNCYIHYDEGTRKGIVIDPATDAARILAEIKMLGLDIVAIVITHGHFDHTGAVDEVRLALDAPVYASKNDAMLANNPDLNGCAFFRIKPVTVTVDKYLEDGPVDFAGINIQVIETPGHTYGSICLYNPEDAVLFAGDTLFLGSYGRYDLPTGEYGALKASLEKLLDLPAHTVAYPGHGPSTTIGHESKNNPIRK